MENERKLWYAIYTHPKQEERVNRNLMAWNVEVFFPKIKKIVFNEFTKVGTEIIKPLFPRYIFARFPLNEYSHKIQFTRGVHSIVGFGSPAPVDEWIIENIKLRRGDDGLIVPNSIKCGDKIKIEAGTFKNFTGLFERETSDNERVLILLDMVSYQLSINVDRALIQKLDTL